MNEKAFNPLFTRLKRQTIIHNCFVECQRTLIGSAAETRFNAIIKFAQKLLVLLIMVFIYSPTWCDKNEFKELGCLDSEAQHNLD